jgi:hypothetical protein
VRRIANEGEKAVEKIKSLIGRRQFLVAGGAASTLALARKAEAAKPAVAGCGANQPTTIHGLTVGKPVHEPYKTPSLAELRAAGVFGTPGSTAAPASAAASGGGASAAGAPAMTAVLGGVAGVSKAVPAIYLIDGKYEADKSKTGALSDGKVNDNFASGVKIKGDADTGGVYVKGLGTKYILADAKIDLSGDGAGLGGACSGAGADDFATLTIRNCTITTSGQSRNATSVQNHSVLKVYNSTLTSNGIPFTPEYTSTAVKVQLEVDGNSRTHVTLSNSYSYFYYSTIIAEGWAALSTDGAMGFVYLEANDCTVKTIKSGYGTYADGACHNFINRCTFDVASEAAIIAGEADITFRDTKSTSGSYFTLIHCVGMPAEVGTLKVTGGEIKAKSAVVMVKSANAEVVFDGVKIKAENGMLLKSAITKQPHAAKAANTKGMNVYGIHATFKNMNVEGDVSHTEDKENRKMTVYLEAATLKGAINDASIKIDRLSKWTATADSSVTIIGDLDVTQIDAPAGVTITAIAAQSGTYKLASCGTLVLKTA